MNEGIAYDSFIAGSNPAVLDLLFNLCTMIPPNQSRERQVILPSFRQLIDLLLRDDDWIPFPTDLAFLFEELDKNQFLVHVEHPSNSSRIKETRLWSIKAWRNDCLYQEKAQAKSRQDRIEFDNMKVNLSRIAEKLHFQLRIPITDCEELAVNILHNNPEGCPLLKIEYTQPYYRGVYVVLPCSKYD